jgi:hypothetical protein
VGRLLLGLMSLPIDAMYFREKVRRTAVEQSCAPPTPSDGRGLSASRNRTRKPRTVGGGCLQPADSKWLRIISNTRIRGRGPLQCDDVTATPAHTHSPDALRTFPLPRYARSRRLSSILPDTAPCPRSQPSFHPKRTVINSGNQCWTATNGSAPGRIRRRDWNCFFGVPAIPN